MDVFLDKKEYRSNIFSLLDNAETFIKNHINVKGEINGMQRKDYFEIPEEALRESLLNALVHRDYTNTGRDIKIGIYDDVVNIVSPGGFPNTITDSDILEGRSEIKNKVVARVMKELNYIEQWGSGIRRIKSSCIKYGLEEPLIKEIGDFVDVELYREKLIDKKTLILAENVNDKLGDKRKLILSKIAEDPRISISELSNIIEVSTTAIENNLRYLKENGYLQRVGSAKSGYWILIKK